MHPARIAELLEPFLLHAEVQSLRAEVLSNISTYIDILLRWNARINLTAIRDPEHIVTRHFGESLFAARHLFPQENRVGTDPARPEGSRRVRPAERSEASAHAEAIADAQEQRGRAALQRRVDGEKNEGALATEADARSRTPNARLADLGSGAGFPGIPIKLWAPEISLTLIESNHKKATFLREVARALTLTDVNIQNVRAETLPAAQFDVVTLRAVERFAEALPAAARLLAPGGRIALLIGSAQLEQAQAILTTFSWSDPLQIPSSKARLLLLGRSIRSPLIS
jgi:16S rRNA (guanine(527)-N(7))-methyltransferase RsmG